MPRLSRTLILGLTVLNFAACKLDGPSSNLDDPLLEPEVELETESASQALRKDRGGSNGSADFCIGSSPCVSGEGDCDRDSECAPGLGLVCARDNGAFFGFPSNFDVCVPSHCVNRVSDGDETGVDCGGTCGTCTCNGTAGSSNFCTPSCPCATGQGDCDRDADCLPGLRCGVNNGAMFGLPSNFDVCVNGVSDAGVADSGLAYTGRTTFYFGSQTNAEVSPSFSARWDRTSDALRKKMFVVKPQSGEEFDNYAFVSVPPNGNGLVSQWVSAPIQAQTISGTVTCLAATRTYNSYTYAASVIVLYVVSGDGSTVRGTLLDFTNGTTNINPYDRSRSFASASMLSSVVAQEGDRLVIELGGHDTSGTGELVRVRRGADLDFPNYSVTNDTNLNKNPNCVFSNAIFVQNE